MIQIPMPPKKITCMRVLSTYLQDRDEAPVKLKSKVLATYFKLLENN